MAMQQRDTSLMHRAAALFKVNKEVLRIEKVHMGIKAQKRLYTGDSEPPSEEGQLLEESQFQNHP